MPENHLRLASGRFGRHFGGAQDYGAALLQEPARHTLADAAANVHVHATRCNGFGMAPLEAMASGLAVTVSGPGWCRLAQGRRYERVALSLDRPDDPDERARRLPSRSISGGAA